MPVIPVLKRWRQENPEFKITLDYTLSSKPVSGLHETLSNKTKPKTSNKNPLFS